MAPDGTEDSLVLDTAEVVGARGGGAAAGTVVGTAALFQPPKSSSAVTWGAGGARKPPGPLLPPNPEVEDELPPQPPRSALWVGMVGKLVVLGGSTLVVAGGSGVAQALFEPHASAVEKPEKTDEEAGGAAGFKVG